MGTAILIAHGSHLILHILMALPALLVFDLLFLDCGTKYADDYTRKCVTGNIP